MKRGIEANTILLVIGVLLLALIALQLALQSAAQEQRAAEYLQYARELADWEAKSLVHAQQQGAVDACVAANIGRDPSLAEPGTLNYLLQGKGCPKISVEDPGPVPQWVAP